MYFAMKEEVGNKVNFLDITISKDDNWISFNICRKPTANDIILTNDSCHPPEHKLAAVRYLTNSLSTYPMNETNKRNKNDKIKHII
jgi:hypothetical protein